MKNSQDGFIAPLVTIIALLLIGTGIYAYQKNTISNSPKVKVTASDKINIQNNPSTVIVQNKTNKPVDSKAATTVSTDKVNTECITTYKAKSTDYVNGEILVGFSTSTSLLSAQKIIGSYGLSSQNSSVGYYFMLHVNVPVGQEFSWACKIKQNENIRYADLNYTATVTGN